MSRLCGRTLHARANFAHSFPMLEASFCADVHRYQVHNQTSAFIDFHFCSCFTLSRVSRAGNRAAGNNSLDWLAFLQFEEVLCAIAIRVALIHSCANVQVLISSGARSGQLPP